MDEEKELEREVARDVQVLQGLRNRHASHRRQQVRDVLERHGVFHAVPSAGYYKKCLDDTVDDLLPLLAPEPDRAALVEIIKDHTPYGGRLVYDETPNSLSEIVDAVYAWATAPRQAPVWCIHATYSTSRQAWKFLIGDLIVYADVDRIQFCPMCGAPEPRPSTRVG